MEQLIKDTIAQLFQHLGLSFTDLAYDASDEEMLRVDITSLQASRIIGWHGETINSIQHLVKAIVRAKENLEKSPFIVLDVDGYRRVQEDKVRRIAEQKAEFARRKKTRVALPPMSPYFRRIVHLYIARHPDYQDIASESIGEGDYRQVVLRLKDDAMSEGEELSPIIEESTPTSEKEAFADLDV